MVQDIEKTLHEYAIDAEIHRNTIMTPSTLLNYFPKCGKPSCGPPSANIGALYYEPKFTLGHEFTADELSLTSFNAYGYAREEVETITSIIKRLFLRRPAYTYNELWESVKNPPFKVSVNAGLFDEGNFAISLTHLIEEPTSMWVRKKRQLDRETPHVELSDSQFVASLFDHDNTIIVREGVRHRIAIAGKYYILMQVDEDGDVIADIDSYMRMDEYKPAISINVESYIIGSKSAYNYESKKQKFYYKYCKTGDMTGFLSEYDARFYFNLLDEIIIHRVVGATTVSKRTEVLYHKVLEELDPFDIIVYARDISKYKNVVRLIRGGMSKLHPKTPMGYIKAKSIKIFDREDWIEIDHATMGRNIAWRENKHIIGFYDSMPDGTTKFKLRPPKSKRDEKPADIRTIETGMVCDTKNKSDLLVIAKHINVTGYDPKNVKIKELCMMIQERLLDLEAKEREKKSSVKYVYLFNAQ